MIRVTLMFTVYYDMCLSHTPPLLLGTLFLSRSAVLIMSLLSDPELKLTFFVWTTNCLNISVVILFSSVLYQLCCWMSRCFFAMFSQCSVTLTMFRYNVLQQCICNLLYACNRLLVQRPKLKKGSI